ncbi:MAG TPA: 8-amino-7-oxononanoate synthase [Planctomycetaceae bacterium]|nr:8-amino-7-oxononanoate synthase [Planctomycetaceae bacterium]
MRRVVEPLGQGRCRIEGRELWDFSSNDYHGFSHNPAIQSTAIQAIEQYGVGARASVLISGWTPAHQDLSDALRNFEAVGDILLCSSGYAACQGAIASLVQEEDILFCDRLNHACLIDGCRLSKAKLRVYRHEDLTTLRRELTKSQSEKVRRWIVTETVFGMDGTLTPLVELVQLAEEFDAYLICDEAHSTGVYGSSGQGLIGQFREQGELTDELIERRIPVRIGTFSKALGSQGGFVAGAAETIRLLWNTSRPLMFSTGLSIAACAAATAAIKQLQAHPQHISKLRNQSREFRLNLKNSGFEVLGQENSPIIPVVLQNEEKTMEWAKELESRGLLVGAIRPPTVPQGTARLRITLSSIHPEKSTDKLIKALQDLQESSVEKI